MHLDYIYPHSSSQFLSLNTSPFQLHIFFPLKNNHPVQLALSLCAWTCSHPLGGHGDPSSPSPKKSDTPPPAASSCQQLCFIFGSGVGQWNKFQFPKTVSSLGSTHTGELLAWTKWRIASLLSVGRKAGQLLPSPWKCRALERWTCLQILKAGVP